MDVQTIAWIAQGIIAFIGAFVVAVMGWTGYTVFDSARRIAKIEAKLEAVEKRCRCS